jgi:ribonuclease VapC
LAAQELSICIERRQPVLPPGATAAEVAEYSPLMRANGSGTLAAWVMSWPSLSVERSASGLSTKSSLRLKPSPTGCLPIGPMHRCRHFSRSGGAQPNGMTAAVSDASALLALLRNEPGWERIRDVLADSARSTVNLGEVVGHFVRNGALETDIRLALGPLPVDWISFDKEMAYTAGLPLSATRRAALSFGDRACLPLTSRLGIRALTADRSWQKIATAAGIEIELIRDGLH